MTRILGIAFLLLLGLGILLRVLMPESEIGGKCLGLSIVALAATAALSNHEHREVV